MAIYRPRRSPWPLAVALAIAGLLVGFLAGYVVFGTRPPDLDAAATAVEVELARARGLLEVAAIEYREGAPDGAIASEPEYAAAEAAVANASAARFGRGADPRLGSRSRSRARAWLRDAHRADRRVGAT